MNTEQENLAENLIDDMQRANAQVHDSLFSFAFDKSIRLSKFEKIALHDELLELRKTLSHIETVMKRG